MTFLLSFGIIQSVKENKDNSTVPKNSGAEFNESDDRAETPVPDAESTAVAKQKPAPAPRGRKKFFSSIRVRTMAINIAYACAILIMLWSCFLVFLFGFYGGQLRDSLVSLGTQISRTFPYRVDDNAFERYKQGLSAVVRNEMVSVTVFTKADDGEYSVVFTMDTFGSSIDQKTDAFDAFMSQLDTEMFDGGEVRTIGTSIGSFICYCDTNEIVTSSGTDTAYLLVVKPYQLLSPTIESIIYALVGCSIVALVLAVLSALVLSRPQTKRIKEISDKAKKLAAGDYTVVFPSGGNDEYDALATTLNLATEEMNKTETLRRDMIANVSHDIRTPLTMIRGYAEMLRDMPLDAEKRKKTANVIIAETERLEALSGDVLSLSKLQAGVIDFSYERVDISKLAHDTIAKFDIFSERDGIEFDCSIADDVYATCDPKRIMQVLYNLIGNAVNYCGDDKTVTISVQKTERGARVEVGDHGKGIEQSELDSVWDRYYRAAQSKRTTVGTGLGLSICKNILDSHAAVYSVRSTLGKGTVFSFELEDKIINNA